MPLLGSLAAGSVKGFGAQANLGYFIGQSLRFRASASAYLSRTPSGTGISRKTMTLSWWFKKAFVSTSDKTIFSTGSNQFVVKFNSGASADKLQVYDYTGSFQLNLQTNQVFRDPAAWYHIVIQLDSTQATSSNRAKVYINGEQITSFASATYPSQNYDYQLNYNIQHNIGNESGSSNYFDGYMGDVYFVDGQALTPSDFGKTDPSTGSWIPKKYSGTYGTNGFKLDFKHQSSASGFNTVLYTGNGGTQTIDGVGFSPDLVWLKNRGTTNSHYLTDSVRGDEKSLNSNATNAEFDYTSFGGLSLVSNGFYVETGTSNVFNTNGNNFVAWCWDAGSSTVSNTDGSITSSVRANPATGFSIVTYTVPSGGTSFTIGHGLGDTPKMIITKSTSAVSPWPTWFSGFTKDQYVNLNTTAATASQTDYWGSATPTSSVFGNKEGVTWNAGVNVVAYCFSEVSGFSKFGSYTGNGSTSGPTVTTGFRPAFLMIKNATTGSSHWFMYDNTRDTDNVLDNKLLASLAEAEGADPLFNINITDTGFQPAANYAGINSSGDTFIYMAFADTRDTAFWKDKSGTDNHWTLNKINYAASAETTYDLMNDVPTLTSADKGNFATLNPIAPSYRASGTSTISDGNLKSTDNASSYGLASIGTIPVSSGKWYWEVNATSIGGNYGYVGIAKTDTLSLGSSNIEGYIYSNLAKKASGAAAFAGIPSTDYGATWTTGDVIGVALDMDAGTLVFYKNGVSQGTAYTGISGEYVAGLGDGQTSTAYTFDINFGQRPFAYTPPTGYKKLNTYNL